jgi:hypothetical protein
MSDLSTTAAMVQVDGGKPAICHLLIRERNGVKTWEYRPCQEWQAKTVRLTGTSHNIAVLPF